MCFVKSESLIAKECNDNKYNLALMFLNEDVNYENAIELANELYNSGDIRGAKILGDIYSNKTVDTHSYYNTELAEKYYLECMRSNVREIWHAVLPSIANLYGSMYINCNESKTTKASDVLRALYCMYLSYLDDNDKALIDMEHVMRFNDINVGDIKYLIWESDYVTTHFSL